MGLLLELRVCISITKRKICKILYVLNRLFLFLCSKCHAIPYLFVLSIELYDMYGGSALNKHWVSPSQLGSHGISLIQREALLVGFPNKTWRRAGLARWVWSARLLRALSV